MPARGHGRVCDDVYRSPAKGSPLTGKVPVPCQRCINVHQRSVFDMGGRVYQRRYQRFGRAFDKRREGGGDYFLKSPPTKWSVGGYASGCEMRVNL